MSYFGDSQMIRNKIMNFSHQEYNKTTYTDLSLIQKRVSESRDLYDRPINITQIKYTNYEQLPPKFMTYLSKYVTIDAA
jgi:hypothetical protein